MADTWESRKASRARAFRDDTERRSRFVCTSELCWLQPGAYSTVPRLNHEIIAYPRWRCGILRVVNRIH